MPGISQSIANLIPFHMRCSIIFKDSPRKYNGFVFPFPGENLYACGRHWSKKHVPPLPSAKSARI